LRKPARRSCWQRRVALLAVLACTSPARAEFGSEPLVLTERIGLEVDAAERAQYHLLPDTEGFRSGTFYRSGPDAVRFRYEIERDGKTEKRSLTLKREYFDLLRRHALLVEAYEDARRQPRRLSEAESLQRLALRYAARGRYTIANDAMSDLAAEFPGDSVTVASAAAREDIASLSALRRALFLPGSLRDQSGRTDLLVFAGYYGLFLGIATPAAFDADEGREIAAGLLAAVPLTLGGTAFLTRNAEIGKGRAEMIALAGQFGTWQGLGWAATPEGDDNNKDVLKAGIFTGAGAIALTTLLTHGREIGEGHAAISSFAWTWGAWFGLVVAQLAGADGDEVLTPALIGSEALLGAALVGARGARVSRARTRLVSLLGIAGGAFGLGLYALGNNGNEERGFASVGVGSLAGLGLGTWLTRSYDRNRDLSVAGP